MWFAAGSEARRALRLAGHIVLVGIVYLLNSHAVPGLHFGILYTVPVLLVTWHDGLTWGVAFACGTSLLRYVSGMELAPDAPLVVRLLNQGTYLVVLGVAMAGMAQLQHTQAALERLATQDPLTGALNARAFAERLTQELDRGRRYTRPMALLYLDLDDFKTVNDRHGHATGDSVLQLVARATRRTMRQSDVVGRLGGDEFAVLMPETEGGVALGAATRLVSEVRSASRDTSGVTASIGLVSTTSAAPIGAEELLRRADQAMYEAKRTGKDRVVQVTI